MSDRYRTLQICSIIAYLIIFLLISAAIGYSHDIIRVLNGVFFAIYVLSLWLAGIDTSDFYDNKIFVSDMISAAIYINIPRLLTSDIPLFVFLEYYWGLFAANEINCLFWDIVCYKKADKIEAKSSHMIWILLTSFGVFVIILLIAIANSTEVSETALILANIILCLYQASLLIAWWISKHCIIKKGLQTSK